MEEAVSVSVSVSAEAEPQPQHQPQLQHQPQPQPQPQSQSQSLEASDAPVEPTPQPEPPQPEPPAAAAAAARLPAERVRKKRKLEELGFHSSTYYRIRKIVRNLRPTFLQLSQDPNFRATTLPADILKDIKTVLELSKQLRTDLAPVAEPGRASSIPPAKDQPGEAFPPTPPAENVNDIISSAEMDAAGEPKDVPFNLDDGLKGSYVVGGSPVGWNFLVYPGNKPVYYGRTKAEKRAHQIEV